MDARASVIGCSKFFFSMVYQTLVHFKDPGWGLFVQKQSGKSMDFPGAPTYFVDVGSLIYLVSYLWNGRKGSGLSSFCCSCYLLDVKLRHVHLWVDTILFPSWLLHSFIWISLLLIVIHYDFFLLILVCWRFCNVSNVYIVPCVKYAGRVPRQHKHPICGFTFCRTYWIK